MSKSKFDGSTIVSIEKRIENGIEFEVSSVLTVANAGGVAQWLFKTGHKQVVIDSRQITTNGHELTYQFFSDTEVSAEGTPVIIGNRNGNSKTLTTASLSASPTVTNNGAPTPAVYIPGSTAIGGRSTSQFDQDGFVRVLKANTDHLLTITNDGDLDDAKVEIYLLWSEVEDPAASQG